MHSLVHGPWNLPLLQSKTLTSSQRNCNIPSSNVLWSVHSGVRGTHWLCGHTLHAPYNIINLRDSCVAWLTWEKHQITEPRRPWKISETEKYSITIMHLQYLIRLKHCIRAHNEEITPFMWKFSLSTGFFGSVNSEHFEIHRAPLIEDKTRDQSHIFWLWIFITCRLEYLDLKPTFRASWKERRQTVKGAKPWFRALVDPYSSFLSCASNRRNTISSRTERSLWSDRHWSSVQEELLGGWIDLH